ncbi:MAG TPA: thiamine pyrophosphate-binding protein [bacterium]|nr:thiamine pyrophosphate-binding protein [bacterium]
MARTYKAKQVFMDTLLAEGVEYIFGNPGTTESPMIDSLLDYPQLKYVLALHEAVAVSMADAYAQVSRKVGVVSLHTAPGLGNGLGAVYNAWEGGTPLIVTAGALDTRLRLREPLLGHDLVAMAAPLTKWSVQVEHPDEMALLMSRAFKVARETPSGPVFVSLPLNVLEQETTHGPLTPPNLFPRSAPDAAGLQEAADLLLQAKKPIIVCGDKVADAWAVKDLTALAEQIGASVVNEVLPSRLNFPNTHPHYRDRGANDQASLRRMIGDADAVLLVGGEFFEELWHSDTSPFPEDAVLIQIDPSPRNMARNYSVHCGLIGDVKTTLRMLNEAVSAGASKAYGTAAAKRREELAALKAKEQERQQARIKETWDRSPMSSARLMVELNDALPPNVAVVHEAITAAADLTRTLSFEGETDYLASRGGGIGQGLPGGIGYKLAYPDRPVLCISGDGSSMYTIQALWTAAHHKIPVVFIILNNRVYRVLKLNMTRFRSEFGLGGERAFPHMDLTDPDLDYVSLAKGLGMDATAVRSPEQVGPAVREAFASGKPWLLDVLLDGSV